MQVTTIITSSSGEKLEMCKSMGADHGINYKSNPIWSEEVLKITKGKGVDQVIETAGQKTIIQSLKSLKWGGLINDIGNVSGKGSDVEELGVSLMVIRKHAMMQGVIVGGKDVLQEVANFYEKEKIVPFVKKCSLLTKRKKHLLIWRARSIWGKWSLV
jgi:NADPH:quinone reductase-like Zn-dependent oxidoreductase